MSAEDELVVSRDAGILLARLNRPASRNALSRNLLSAIAVAALEAEADPQIKVLVLTGTGDKAFCAGMDLAEFASAGEGVTVDPAHMAAFQRLTRGNLGVPVIGAANATAVGGGLELLLGCDVIVASSEAKFGFPEVKRGLFAAGGGTFIATRIPLNIGLEMILTGDYIDATRAYEIGLVNRVVAPDDVLSTALDLASRIAANGPLGVAASKELTRLAPSDPRAAEARAVEWQRTVFTSEDAREGATAFIEKRTPVWQGR
jgi:enoyl-CoA hydratase/carnithine racemase